MSELKLKSTSFIFVNFVIYYMRDVSSEFNVIADRLRDIPEGY